MATAVASPQSVGELVRQNPSKRGLAIIVTNGYEASTKLSTLKGPKKDGDRMREAFNRLQIATYCKHNVGCGELRKILKEVSGIVPSKTYESISFVFAGHGLETRAIYLQDGGTVPIQEIINSLLPHRAPNIGNIPKLFFFDACRGSNDIKPVMVPRSGGRVSQNEREVLGRGANDIKTVLVPPEGNTLVAYATMPRYKAHENGEDGGIWMKALASKLVASKEPIEVVLTKVREQLHATYQDPQWAGYMQMPETINTLLRPVYLNPLAPPRVLDASPPNVSPPGCLTQRDDDHPGHYRGKLVQLVQQHTITDVKEEYKDSFICVLTFVHAATRRKLQFKSEMVFKSKAEAKESAAKIAILSLEGGSPQRPPQARGSPDPISQLKEHCDRKKIPQPQYEEVKCSEQQFKYRVTVEGKTFGGRPQSTKKAAQKDAAQNAVYGLKL